MYSPTTIAARETQLLARPEFRGLFPHGLPIYPLADSDALTALIAAAKDETGAWRRRLTPEEGAFIAATQFRCALDFPYWCTRFVQVDDQGHGLRRLDTLSESQQFVLDKIGAREVARWGVHPDGLLFNILKARQLYVCLDPETRILTADLRWVKLDTATVGDELVSVDEDTPGGRGSGRKMRVGYVEAKREVVAPAFRLTLDNGEVLVATAKHRFLTRNRGGTETIWRRVERMRVGERLRVVTQPWGDSTLEDAWFGGLVDGEGSLRSEHYTGAKLYVSQVAGAVYDRVLDYVRTRGYAFYEAIDQRPPGTTSKFGKKAVYTLSLGRMGELLRILGQTRPIRFAKRRWWMDKDLPGKRVGGAWARLVSIEPLGSRRMIDLQTSTKTFIAEGLVSHNSTLSEALVAHRVLYQPATRGLSGADVEEQAGYLFRMVVRIYDHLPWFLRPAPRFPFVKNREMGFGNGSFLKTAWGKSTRGALQAVTGQEGSKGAIGRGQTYGVVHLSELPTWDNPDQIDSALLPAIPIHPDTLVLFEATAEYAGDWWHQHYQAAAAGDGRFANIFVPVYAEPTKYSLPAPLDWTPASTTRAWATKCERTSTQWYPTEVTLTRDQLYWYETTRAYYERKGDLGTFLKEFCADDQECFQYAGRSIFTFAQLDAIDAAGSKRKLLDVWTVEPARDIAELRRLPADVDEAAPDSRVARRRPDPPLSMKIARPTSPLAADAYPVPPGYGFQRLSKEALKDLPSLRASVLALWEYPRARGRRRYVMAVDVAQGLQQDYSVVTVVRQPTIEEPAEEVAQFVSNTVDTMQLAFVCDAIGRLYSDEDGLEALAAIECGPAGPGLAVQNTLQLHLGYANLYVWRYLNAANPDRQQSTALGWHTTAQSRPILIGSFKDAITSFDELTKLPDFILNSPTTRGELRHLITLTGRLVDAEAARGQHDDAIMSAGIGYYVAWQHAGGETEPIAEKRRRRAALQRQIDLAPTVRCDWRNSAVTSDEQHAHLEDDDEFADALSSSDGSLHFDARTRE